LFTESIVNQYIPKRTNRYLYSFDHVNSFTGSYGPGSGKRSVGQDGAAKWKLFLPIQKPTRNLSTRLLKNQIQCFEMPP
jgi:hypothetical protein